jgi:hypothetical protein
MECDRRTLRAIRAKARNCKGRLGYMPDILNPRSLNEKILRRQFQEPDPIMSLTSDKLAVKEWLEETAAENPELKDLKPVPTLWHGTGPVPWDTLEYPCVLKANHGQGMCEFIESAPPHAERIRLERQCRLWLFKRLSPTKHEPHYDSISPALLVEPVLADNTDYKFYVFNCVVEFVAVAKNLPNGKVRDYRTKEWEQVPFGRARGSNFKSKEAEVPIKATKPANFARMIKLAEALARQLGIPGREFVRIDLYNVDGVIYLGEVTWTPGSGRMGFRPPDWDQHFGDKFPLELNPLETPYGILDHLRHWVYRLRKHRLQRRA